MTRVLTAAVVIAVLLGALAAPPIVFQLLVLAVTLGAWAEYARLTEAAGAPTVSAPGGLLSVGVAAAFLSPRPEAPLLALVIATLLLALAVLRDHWGDSGGAFRAFAAGLAGLVWLGLFLGCQAGLRGQPAGATWLILGYAAVAVGDSAAYYGGSTLGRHRLAPELSPNKTLEGSAFGLVGSAATAAVVASWLPGLSTAAGAALGLALGLLGQAGDLIESALKRTAGVKDSAHLLPGHGGILDRIDAHLPAGGLLWAVVTFGWLV